ncbi:condensin complex subunit 1 [Phakopsora pachyrhizi]|nr:condensin complex subunit 1 [Phakopsora pachyrhizi]
MVSEWNLPAGLTSLLDQPEIENETNFGSLSPSEVKRGVNSLVDQLAASSHSITRPDVFDTFQSLLNCADSIPQSALYSILDVLPSSFEAEVVSTSRDANPSDHTAYKSHRPALERYAFLLLWLVEVCEKRRLSERGLDGVLGSQIEKQKVPKSKSAKQKTKSSGNDKNTPFDWADQIVDVLGSMLKALGLKTDFIWPTSQERDAFVGCFTKPVYQILDMKMFADNSAIRAAAFKIICTAAKSHGQAYSTQTSILQKLQYFDHLSEYMAELTHLLVESKDLPQLADAILREISSKTFSAQDSKGPRSFSRYLVRLTTLSPRLVFRQIVMLQKHLDSENYVMRICLLEVFGKLIEALSQDDDQQTGAPGSSTHQNGEIGDEDGPARASGNNEKEKEPQAVKLDGFFNLLFERFCDSNTFVRLKVVSIFEDIIKLPVPFPKHRLRLAACALRSLEDKSSQVRKHCITVLRRLIETHPYGVMHGGELEIGEWQARYDGIVNELKVFDLPSNGVDEEVRKIMKSGESTPKNRSRSGSSESLKLKSEDDERPSEDGKSNCSERPSARRNPRQSCGDMDSAAVDQQMALSNYDHVMLMKLRLTKKYYSDAIQFIQILQSAIPLIEKLLASKIKSEVLEAIYFFKTAWTYKIKGSQGGIRRMLHLIWSSDNSTNEEPSKDVGPGNEEAPKDVKGVRFALIDCYQELYFASLVREEGESLLAYADRNIDRIAKNMIELTYQATLAELTSLEELLSMMMERGYVHEDVIYKLWEVYGTSKDISKAQRRGAIIVLGMLAVPRRNVADLVLAKYSCIALGRLGGSAKKVKGSLVDRNTRLPMDHPVFQRLADAIKTPTKSKEWFAMAEQALNTIYGLGDQPDHLCTEILQKMTVKCFEGTNSSTLDDANGAMNIDQQAISDTQTNCEIKETEDVPQPGSRRGSSTDSKCLVDYFVLSQVIFLAGHSAVKQLCHLELVEREFKRRKAEIDELKKKQDSTNQGQTNKEKDAEGEELDQVAGNVEDDIGDIIAHAREKELMFGDRSLFAVFGPISVQICGLPSVYKILETTKNPAVRSNIIIALGDIAVCFATIIDQHSDGLYKGLTDSDLEVKKNTLMVLTHLILNGMIKVKGQLGEIAKCINDPEKRISDLAQLFFDELSKKDQNAIYNNLPDMISHLSVGKHAVDSSLFQLVMESIFKHLKKDKQSESIVEKLCQRFRLVSEVRQWRDIAYCLALLQFKSEKSLKKLVDGLPFYQDKLYDAEVFKCFEEILVKVKANKWAKDHADLVEFEKALRQQKEKGEEDMMMENKVQKKQTARRRKQKQGRRVKDEEEDEDEDMEDEGLQNEQATLQPSNTKNSQKSKTRQMPSRSRKAVAKARDATPSSDE